jgi:hypothetical protein
MSAPDRRRLVDRHDGKLSIRRQCGGRRAGCVIASTLRWRLNALGAARLIPERRVPHPAAAPSDPCGTPGGGVMFPIPSERKLSFVEIANYWSREIEPSASPQELRDVLSKAWWRGQLVAANGSNRLSILREYYLRSANFIAFVIPGMEEPEQWRSGNDGEVEFVRPLRVPLPNADSDTWTDVNCAAAFEAIAEQWKEAMISPTVFLDVVLTSGEFFQWIELSGYIPPTFWSDERQKDDPANAADATVPRIEITKAEPETKKSSAAWHAINNTWPEGPPINLQTAAVHRGVNKWIAKQPRTKYSFTEVSRETVARLLRRK